jgi:O-antigen/teichoic acid export membrane protein
MSANVPDQKSRVVRNGIYSALSWLLPIILAFVATPIVVHGLGTEQYGLYALVLGFISYSFTFGVGRIAAKYVAEFRASGEPDKISESVSATFWFSLLIALLGVTLVALTARLIVVDVLFIPEEHQGVAVSAIYLACVTILFTMLSQVFQYVLQGVHSFDRYLLLTNVAGVLLNFGSIGLVWLGYGVEALVAWNLVVVVLIGLLFYWNARRLLPELTFRTDIRSGIWTSVVKYGGSIILYQIFGNLILIFERAWIVRNFGSESLTYYVVPMTLGLYLHGFVGSVVLVLFPVVNELLDNPEKLVRLYKQATKLVVAFIMFSFVSAVAGGEIFLTRWISAEFAARSYRLLVIHMATFALLANVTITWQITESFRSAGLNALMTFLWFVISVPLMIYLSQRFGTEGVAIGRFAGILVSLPMIYLVEKRFLGSALARFWFTNLMRLCVAAVGMAFVQWLVFAHLPATWPTLVLGFAAGAIVYGSLLLLAGYFDRQERQQFGSLVFGR